MLISKEMKTRNKSLYLLACIVLLCGCEKYVDIKTQGNLVPNQTLNYRYLLNNSNVYEPSINLADFASDDVNIIDPGQIASLNNLYTNYIVAAYNWQPVLYQVGNPSYEQDQNWNTMYTRILNCNTIIAELPASNGTDAEKAALTAEALVHRADAYLVLVNTYAKPYDQSTAAVDLGVPLLLAQTISQRLDRATVQAVYAQIINDLTASIPALPNTQLYNTLPSKVSAYAELARCYLYMKDYPNASRYADMALAVRNTLNDLGALSTVNGANYPRRIVDPEILLSKTSIGGPLIYDPVALRLSDDLLSLLGTRDQRYLLFTTPASSISTSYTGRYFYREYATGETRNVGPSVPEMMLIRAEGYARSGDAVNAMVLVNNLRQKRFAPADYSPLSAVDASDALVKVIEERRREFFGRMLRWWDMRRLKNEAPFQHTYIRNYGSATYRLEPNSNRYVFPIAEYIRSLNPELQQNP
jgi:tetratricopeptide (TPR) repeat protein